MRPASDMPRRPRRRRFSGRGRFLIAGALVALLVLLLSLRGIARFYTDYLWFDQLGQTSVWRSVLGAKVALVVLFTGVFFVLAWVNLYLADRMAPLVRPAGPEEEMLAPYHAFVERRTGLVRVVVALLLAIIAGAGVSGRWHDWILFTNGGSWGVDDPQFGRDIGFYVFDLPFITFVVNWLFVALVIVLIITAIAHYLNGGIRVNTRGQRVTPQVKAHLSVLLAALAAVKAVDYWYDRFELVFSTRGVVDGATYTDVNAQLPATNLLLLISLFAVGLLIVNIRRRGWVLPALAVGLWAFVAIVMGGIYPAIMQQFVVEPNEQAKEEPFIERNIAATKAALGLAEVEEGTFSYDGDLPSDELLDAQSTLSNIRLLDPRIVRDSFALLQAERPFYRFSDDVDVDRYEIEGERTQVIIGARELNLGGLQNRSWVREHLLFTHGYGVAMAPANSVSAEGVPQYVVGNIPLTIADELRDELPIETEQIYYGEKLSGYAVVGTDEDETDFVGADGTTESFRYDGDGGVTMGSFLRRAAFALRFGELEPLISGSLTGDSKVIYVRDVRDRVQQLVPFLELDADPYPVIHDGGIVYIVDAYTTTSRYPYAQRASTGQLDGDSGLNKRFNYVRNSVKAVVNAYDGTVDLYVVDDTDPLIQAYRKAFPSLFRDRDEMPTDLREHLRYPEDLFRAQTNMWGRYHIETPDEFFSQATAWAVSQNPGDSITGGSRTPVLDSDGNVVGSLEERVDPYYLIMNLPDQGDDEDFVIFRPFVAQSTGDDLRELTAFMVGFSDPDKYGRLREYQIAGTEVDGPALIDQNIEREPEISAQRTLLGQGGSQILDGNLLMYPVGESLLYVRPLYVRPTPDDASQVTEPTLELVIVSLDGRIEFGESLGEALAALFADVAVDEVEALIDQLDVESVDPDEPDPGPDDGPDIVPDDVSDDVRAELEEIQALFQEARDALPDFTEYDRLWNQALERLDRLVADTGGQLATTTTEPADGGDADDPGEA